MEELLSVLGSGLIEFLLEMLVYFGFDLRWRNKDGSLGCGYLLVFFVLGAVTGALFNLAVPRLLLPYPALRVLALLLGPPAAGAASYGLACLRKSHGARVQPAEHFWTALVFALAFDLVRFAYGRVD
ncbi:MAG: hypothetical protein K2W96_20655 [Gemmataceae bacterium]|nr:hypothetical protein [Gemmataceae bacterium]